LKLGDVHWVELPDRGGREQRGRRPAVIWQDTATFPLLPTVLIIRFLRNKALCALLPRSSFSRLRKMD